MNKNMYAEFRKSVGVDFITTKVHNFNLYFYKTRTVSQWHQIHILHRLKYRLTSTINLVIQQFRKQEF